eukprot:TRINITY_DN6973_c0_g1_i1.p1 TRINITY_DN6973_c0_g1~~TRINITY_DN6973_c0_g1_i1.p1  ORF type:complete len:2519 (-),score=291.64 TRINITY_DN6973_c0_g1_i1:50-7582(-)
MASLVFVLLFSCTTAIDLTWYTDASSLSFPRSNAASAVIGNSLFIIGGDEGFFVHSSVQKYDPIGDTWVGSTGLPNPLTMASAIGLQGSIFVFGGLEVQNDGSKVASNKILKLTPQTGGTAQWAQIASLPVAVADSSQPVLLNGKIIFAGGWNGTDVYDYVFSFDPLSNQVQFLPPLGQKRRGCALALWKERLMAIGGSDGVTLLGSAEVLIQTWQLVANMIQRRYRSAVVQTGKYTVALGGATTGTTATNTTEYFDPVTNLWATSTSMATAKFGMAYGLYNGRLFLAGGQTGTQALSSHDYVDVQSPGECATYQWSGSPLDVSRTNLQTNGDDFAIYLQIWTNDSVSTQSIITKAHCTSNEGGFQVELNAGWLMLNLWQATGLKTQNTSLFVATGQTRTVAIVYRATSAAQWSFSVDGQEKTISASIPREKPLHALFLGGQCNPFQGGISFAAFDCGIQTIPYFESFDSYDITPTGTCSLATDPTLGNGTHPEQWQTFPTDDPDAPYTAPWRVVKAQVATNTGPVTDHSGNNGNYLITETADCFPTITQHVLWSPLFRLPAVQQATTAAVTISFWYHAWGSGPGSLFVDADFSGKVVPSLLVIHENANQWRQASIVLNSYLILSTTFARFKFRYIAATRVGAFALDDVLLTFPVINISSPVTPLVESTLSFSATAVGLTEWLSVDDISIRIKTPPPDLCAGWRLPLSINATGTGSIRSLALRPSQWWDGLAVCLNRNGNGDRWIGEIQMNPLASWTQEIVQFRETIFTVTAGLSGFFLQSDEITVRQGSCNNASLVDSLSYTTEADDVRLVHFTPATVLPIAVICFFRTGFGSRRQIAPAFPILQPVTITSTLLFNGSVTNIIQIDSPDGLSNGSDVIELRAGSCSTASSDALPLRILDLGKTSRQLYFSLLTAYSSVVLCRSPSFGIWRQMGDAWRVWDPLGFATVDRYSWNFDLLSNYDCTACTAVDCQCNQCVNLPGGLSYFGETGFYPGPPAVQTPGTGPGPLSNTTQRIFMYAEGDCAGTALLSTPLLSLLPNTVGGNIFFSFLSYTFGDGIGSIHVDARKSLDPRDWTLDVGIPITGSEATWRRRVVTLFGWQAVQPIAFRLRYTHGSTVRSDVAVDDLAVGLAQYSQDERAVVGLPTRFVVPGNRSDFYSFNVSSCSGPPAEVEIFDFRSDLVAHTSTFTAVFLSLPSDLVVLCWNNRPLEPPVEVTYAADLLDIARPELTLARLTGRTDFDQYDYEFRIDSCQGAPAFAAQNSSTVDNVVYITATTASTGATNVLLCLNTTDGTALSPAVRLTSLSAFSVTTSSITVNGSMIIFDAYKQLGLTFNQDAIFHLHTTSDCRGPQLEVAYGTPLIVVDRSANNAVRVSAVPAAGVDTIGGIALCFTDGGFTTRLGQVFPTSDAVPVVANAPGLTETFDGWPDALIGCNAQCSASCPYLPSGYSVGSYAWSLYDAAIPGGPSLRSSRFLVAGTSVPCPGAEFTLITPWVRVPRGAVNSPGALAFYYSTWGSGVLHIDARADPTQPFTPDAFGRIVAPTGDWRPFYAAFPTWLASPAAVQVRLRFQPGDVSSGAAVDDIGFLVSKFTSEWPAMGVPTLFTALGSQTDKVRHYTGSCFGASINYAIISFASSGGVLTQRNAFFDLERDISVCLAPDGQSQASSTTLPPLISVSGSVWFDYEPQVGQASNLAFVPGTRADFSSSSDTLSLRTATCGGNAVLNQSLAVFGGGSTLGVRLVPAESLGNAVLCLRRAQYSINTYATTKPFSIQPAGGIQTSSNYHNSLWHTGAALVFNVSLAVFDSTAPGALTFRVGSCLGADTAVTSLSTQVVNGGFSTAVVFAAPYDRVVACRSRYDVLAGLADLRVYQLEYTLKGSLNVGQLLTLTLKSTASSPVLTFDNAFVAKLRQGSTCAANGAVLYSQQMDSVPAPQFVLAYVQSSSGWAGDVSVCITRLGVGTSELQVGAALRFSQYEVSEFVDFQWINLTAPSVVERSSVPLRNCALRNALSVIWDDEACEVDTIRPFPFFNANLSAVFMNSNGFISAAAVLPGNDPTACAPLPAASAASGVDTIDILHTALTVRAFGLLHAGFTQCPHIFALNEPCDVFTWDGVQETQSLRPAVGDLLSTSAFQAILFPRTGAIVVQYAGMPLMDRASAGVFRGDLQDGVSLACSQPTSTLRLLGNPLDRRAVVYCRGGCRFLPTYVFVLRSGGATLNATALLGAVRRVSLYLPARTFIGQSFSLNPNTLRADVRFSGDPLAVADATERLFAGSPVPLQADLKAGGGGDMAMDAPLLVPFGAKEMATLTVSVDRALQVGTIATLTVSLTTNTTGDGLPAGGTLRVAFPGTGRGLDPTRITAVTVNGRVFTGSAVTVQGQVVAIDTSATPLKKLNNGAVISVSLSNVRVSSCRFADSWAFSAITLDPTTRGATVREWAVNAPNLPCLDECGACVFSRVMPDGVSDVYDCTGTDPVDGSVLRWQRVNMRNADGGTKCTSCGSTDHRCTGAAPL